MEDYKKERKKTACLECGKRITYGRSDKKFCCPTCKDNFNNRNKKNLLKCRRYAINNLEKNRDILDKLLNMGINSIGLAEVTALGFNQNFVSTRIQQRSYQEFVCYDIAFRISASKIFNIHKISLLLPNV